MQKSSVEWCYISPTLLNCCKLSLDYQKLILRNTSEFYFFWEQKNHENANALQLFQNWLKFYILQNKDNISEEINYDKAYKYDYMNSSVRLNFQYGMKKDTKCVQVEMTLKLHVCGSKCHMYDSSANTFAFVCSHLNEGCHLAPLHFFETIPKEFHSGITNVLNV